MEWRYLVLGKVILFLFSVITFIAYNFWELHRDSKKDEAEDPSGQVSEPDGAPPGPEQNRDGEGTG